MIRDVERQLSGRLGCPSAPCTSTSRRQVGHMRGSMKASGSSPRRNRGPEPLPAAASSGLYRRHEVSERQPQPMQPVRSSRRRSRSTMRSSRRRRHVRESLAHSALVGARSSGSVRSDRGDVGEREADALGGADECQASKGVASEPPLAGRRSRRGDQALRLVEPDRRGGQPAARSHLADRQHVVASHRSPPARLDFKCT